MNRAGRSRDRVAALLALFSAGLAACEDEVPPVGLPATCDAGDEAFVARAMPLIWGRKPHGAAEIGMWAGIAADHGRDVAVRAMTRSPDYREHWRAWIQDALAVARTGDQSYRDCFAEPMLASGHEDLAAFIRATPADGAAWPDPFNMADVLVAAVAADDLSIAWRAHLFATMNRPVQGANVSQEELEYNRRVNFGEVFFKAWLNRSLTCMACHNSEYSVTGSEDPALDRTWEIPGLFERALFGDSYGIPEETAYAVFRYADLVYSPYGSGQGGERPWGMDAACGRFQPAWELHEDALGESAFFIQDLGGAGSVWDVERALHDGVASLAGAGLSVAADGTVDGAEGFAYLVAASIADQVFREAAGERLTIAHTFPRNQPQRDRLRGLADGLVEDGFSLRNLLVAVATDPTFNLGAPATCASQPYGVEPVFNPWSSEEADPLARGNSPGDQVHRHRARTLVRSVHDSLGWETPGAFPGSNLLELEGQLGGFLRASQPGFSGTDLQGLLAFEASFGACEDPAPDGPIGCTADYGRTGCEGCACEACVCDRYSYCCDYYWGFLCAYACRTGCGGCADGRVPRDDTVDRLLAAAVERGATVGEVVLALKDRLVARGEFTEAERDLVEELLATPLDRPLAEAPDLEPKLRVLCGALLLSPDYYLALDPGPAGPVPDLTLDAQEDCERLARWVAHEGVDVRCEDGTVR